ncbi:MAG: efflux transporter periplasmic adaptor subunit, partial [Planctomycetota bacterium]
MDRKIEKKRWTWKRVTLAAAAAGAVMLLLYLFFIRDHIARQAVSSDRLIISTVEHDAFQEFIQVSGTVIPIKTNFLDAIEGGKVETVYLEAGSYVNKGDRILKLANTN